MSNDTELAQSIAEKARADKAEAVVSDPQQLHAHCLRTLNEGQIAHLFGERMTEIVNRAARAEAELATERARLDWLEGNAGDIPKYNSNSFIWFANQNIRAAIDAAMQEAAK